MKRELKLVLLFLHLNQKQIAEPIPMKRELKLPRVLRNILNRSDCRAYPDEKGIETGD